MTAAVIPECEACRPDARKLTDEEIARYAEALPQWRVETVDDVPRLQRCYRVRNFAEALSLTGRVGDLAESIGHHPQIVTEWGRVTVRWWSHKIRGLHELDFALAKRCDALAESEPARMRRPALTEPRRVSRRAPGSA